MRWYVVYMDIVNFLLIHQKKKQKNMKSNRVESSFSKYSNFFN